MFETRSSNGSVMNDTTPLLPTYRKSNDDNHRSKHQKSSSYSTTALLMVVGCMVSLGLLAVVAYSSGNSLSPFAMQLQAEESEPVSENKELEINGVNGTIDESESNSHLNLPICDPSDGTQCNKRVLGYCFERKPCIAPPTSFPSSAPTPKPSTVDDCDPFNPPCIRSILGVCFEHSKCLANIGSPTTYPTSKPTNIASCDPSRPPCKTRVLGVCWVFYDCHEIEEGNEEGSEEKGGKVETEEPLLFPTSVPTPKPSTTSDCDPLNPPCKKDIFSMCYEYWDCAAEGNHDSYPEKPLFQRNKPSNEPSESPSKEDEKDDKHEKDNEDEHSPGFHWSWSLKFGPNGTDLTPSPTFEPTTKHNCDPENPPCKTWSFGICTTYEKCYGVHTTPVNMTFDDDEIGTAEPTQMPVPKPTPVPSHAPTSTPTTSAPTLTGYTPSPTISMKPTASETSGPTMYSLCDPQNPPCENYFFGVCLGLRHCLGSHEPTPAPTPVPSLETEYPTSSPTTSQPTPSPTIATSAPTDTGETLSPTVATTTMTPTVTETIIVPDVTPLPTDEPTDVAVVEVASPEAPPEAPADEAPADEAPPKAPADEAPPEAPPSTPKDAVTLMIEAKMKELSKAR